MYFQELKTGTCEIGSKYSKYRTCSVKPTRAMIDCRRDVTVFRTYPSVFRCMPSAVHRLTGSSEVNWRSDSLCPFAADEAAIVEIVAIAAAIVAVEPAVAVAVFW